MDYCVKATVLEALSRGFGVVLLVDAVKGVDSEGSRLAIEEAVSRGAQRATLSELEWDGRSRRCGFRVGVDG